MIKLSLWRVDKNETVLESSFAQTQFYCWMEFKSWTKNTKRSCNVSTFSSTQALTSVDKVYTIVFVGPATAFSKSKTSILFRILMIPRRYSRFDLTLPRVNHDIHSAVIPIRIDNIKPVDGANKRQRSTSKRLLFTNETRTSLKSHGRRGSHTEAQLL